MVTVQRDKYDAQSTQGHLSIDGAFECYTLEPRADQSQGKPYAIPAGTYRYVVIFSARFARKVIALVGVPDFTAVEIHPGNFPQDTHGCTLVGETEGTDFVGKSDAEFETLINKIPWTGTVQYLDAQR